MVCTIRWLEGSLDDRSGAAEILAGYWHFLLVGLLQLVVVALVTIATAAAFVIISNPHTQTQTDTHIQTFSYAGYTRSSSLIRIGSPI